MCSHIFLQAYDDVLVSEILEQSYPQAFFVAEILKVYSFRDPVSEIMDVEWRIVRSLSALKLDESFFKQWQREISLT